MVNNKLWYTHAATEWTEALPLGNGHIGAMAYGGEEGRFDLSENTCWSGAKAENPLKPGAAESMELARELLLKGDYAQAEKELENCLGQRENYGTQVPMAQLFVSVEAECARQSRELDLTAGVTCDRLQCDSRSVVRTGFISNPSKWMGVRVMAGGEELPRLRLWLNGYSEPSKTEIAGTDLIVTGRALENIHSDGLHGVEYRCHLRYFTDGTVFWNRRGLLIDGATHLEVYVTAATSLFGADMEKVCRERLTALDSGWDALLEEHIREHSGWMNRCTLWLPQGEQADLPTDERLERFRTDGADKSLISLMFQYGRYLLLNSSRPDSLLPAALQGVWNDNRACRMEWTDDFHLDINTQMNYFPAESTGLGECTRPLFRWIEKTLVPEGERIARRLYGAEGWVAHTVSNAFGFAAPGWGLDWGLFLTGGAWVATHLWRHYLFTGDRAFLAESWETLKGSAAFLLDSLRQEPESGKWMTVPSYSPENVLIWRDGKRYPITVGATADLLITKYVFSAVLEAGDILGRQDAVLERIRDMLPKLPAFLVGKHGQLQEWFFDCDEALPDHRHTSHLLSLYPFGQITLEDTPELAQAAKVSLARRLGEDARDIVYANWAGALLILYHARFRDGVGAGRFAEKMLSFLARKNMMITHQGETTSIVGGVYELDGNTGFTAGVVEMLVQGDRKDRLRVLPALPADWPEGRYTGLVVYGGHTVDAAWEQGVASEIRVCAGGDVELTVEYAQASITCSFERGQTRVFVYSEAENRLVEKALG